MMDNSKMMGDYERTKQVILSCKNAEQLKVAVRMYNQLNRMHALPEKQLDILENLIGLMRVNFGLENIDGGMSSIGKEFKKASISSGTPELKKIQFSESKKTLTEKEIAEKHNVDIEDIKKEISIGVKIEMEHTEDKKEARKIAMDHISEVADYYSDPQYGIIAIEDKQKQNKKSVRISKKDMKKLHDEGKVTIDGIEINFKSKVDESLDYNEIVKSLRDQLKRKTEKRFSKDKIFDVIRRRKEEELERRKKEIEDFNKFKEDSFEEVDDEDIEIDEATGAVSSGSYVGAAGGPISRLFSKPNFSSKNKMDKPIGKVFTYDGETPKMIHEDDIDEATGASANATYATSPWGKSKFMLTDKGPGKVPVKKTQPDMSNLGYQKVRVKERCKTFPYCNQSPEAIEFYNEGRVVKKIKKSNLKLK
jgi:hypothetical protein